MNSKDWNSFREKFAVSDTGVWLYKTTACMERHDNLTYQEQMRPRGFNKYGWIDYITEMNLIDRASEIVLETGKKARGQLEDFVKDNSVCELTDIFQRKE